MGLFDLFRKKQKLTEEQKKWNKMWDLWAAQKAESPSAELMTYQSEVNNGGHDQYFWNLENSGILTQEMAVLKTILSEKLKCNLETAYKAFRILQEKEEDEKAEEILSRCDDIFYDSHAEMDGILEAYAAKVEMECLTNHQSHQGR